jgi:hypothetical protein
MNSRIASGLLRSRSSAATVSGVVVREAEFTQPCKLCFKQRRQLGFRQLCGEIQDAVGEGSIARLLRFLLRRRV